MSKRRNQIKLRSRNFFRLWLLIFPILLIELFFFLFLRPRDSAWEPVFWDWSRSTAFAVNSFMGWRCWLSSSTSES